MQNIKQCLIAVDFHGTCVGHDYPAVGKTIDMAVFYLQKLQQYHKLCLWTCANKQELHDAIEWFAEHNIRLDEIAYYPKNGVVRKIDTDWFIDNKAIGTPLMPDPNSGGKDIIDWHKLGRRLYDLDLLPDYDHGV